MKTLIKLALTLSVALTASAFAATTVTIPVTANVVGDCSITAAGVEFGAYDRASGNSGIGTVTANCTLDLTADISLDDGERVGRLMTNGSDDLAYTLSKDEANTQTWGEGAEALTISGTGADDTRTIYGRIAPGQNVSKGAYSDSVTATITFAP